MSDPRVAELEAELEELDKSADETVQFWKGKFRAEQARVRELEAGMREIRWLHHDDSKTYQQLWVEAARIADRLVPANEETDGRS